MLQDVRGSGSSALWVSQKSKSLRIPPTCHVVPWASCVGRAFAIALTIAGCLSASPGRLGHSCRHRESIGANVQPRRMSQATLARKCLPKLSNGAPALGLIPSKCQGLRVLQHAKAVQSLAVKSLLGLCRHADMLCSFSMATLYVHTP